MAGFSNAKLQAASGLDDLQVAACAVILKSLFSEIQPTLENGSLHTAANSAIIDAFVAQALNHIRSLVIIADAPKTEAVLRQFASARKYIGKEKKIEDGATLTSTVSRNSNKNKPASIGTDQLAQSNSTTRKRRVEQQQVLQEAESTVKSGNRPEVKKSKKGRSLPADTRDIYEGHIEPAAADSRILSGNDLDPEIPRAQLVAPDFDSDLLVKSAITSGSARQNDDSSTVSLEALETPDDLFHRKIPQPGLGPSNLKPQSLFRITTSSPQGSTIRAYTHQPSPVPAQPSVPEINRKLQQVSNQPNLHRRQSFPFNHIPESVPALSLHTNTEPEILAHETGRLPEHLRVRFQHLAPDFIQNSRRRPDLWERGETRSREEDSPGTVPSELVRNEGGALRTLVMPSGTLSNDGENSSLRKLPQGSEVAREAANAAFGTVKDKNRLMPVVSSNQRRNRLFGRDLEP